MELVGIASLVIAVGQVTGVCLKSATKIVETSQNSSRYLKDIVSDLYSFNAAIANLREHLVSCEEDQARLNALSSLEGPLTTSEENLKMIKSQLEDTTFVRKYLFGVGLDKKMKDCLRSLKTGRNLFHDVLDMDERSVCSSGDLRSSRFDVLNLTTSFSGLSSLPQKNTLAI